MEKSRLGDPLGRNDDKKLKIVPISFKDFRPIMKSQNESPKLGNVL